MAAEENEVMPGKMSVEQKAAAEYRETHQENCAVVRSQNQLWDMKEMGDARTRDEAAA